jgi:hypothetical protein
MTPKTTLLPLFALLALSSVACQQAKSANPLSPDVAGPIPGVEISAPRTLDPGNGQQVASDGTPQTLLVENAGTNGQRPLFLQIEVASDATFRQLLHHADRVEPGSNGRTAYRMPEPLGPGYTYYWRARALDGVNAGPYSDVAAFAIVSTVSLETPTPLEPLGAINTNRPRFVVRNGQITGPAGAVAYRFEIGTALDQPPAAVVTTAPGGDGTTSISIGDLPFDTTVYWRVRATNGVVDSPYSGIVSFRTPPSPSAPAPPPGNGGGETPLPGGAGGRTPDPPSGQRLPLPDMSHVVQQVAAARPQALRNSCQDGGGTWEFMDLLVRTLRTHDTRWGYNCKRGNCQDISHDVVDYHWGAGPSEGSREVYTIDVIGGHCGSDPQPAWINTQPGGGPGESRWTCAGKC